MVLFGEDGSVPGWVAALAALLALVLTPGAILLDRVLTRRSERRRQELTEDSERRRQEHEVQEGSATHKALAQDRRERGTLEQMKKLLDTINEERGRDVARWAVERDAMERKIGVIDNEAEECKVKSARQEERIDWLTAERTRQDEEIKQLKRRLGDLSHSIGKDQHGPGTSGGSVSP